MVTPIADQSSLRWVLANILHTTLPLGFVANPAIEPFSLPQRTRAAKRLVDAARASTFQSPRQRVEFEVMVVDRREKRMPVIRHDRVVRDFDTLVRHRGEFPGENVRGSWIAQRRFAYAGIEILLHRAKILPLETAECRRGRRDRVQRIGDHPEAIDRLQRQAVVAARGDEITSAFDLPMRQSSAGEARGFDEKRHYLKLRSHGSAHAGNRAVHYRQSGGRKTCERGLKLRATLEPPSHGG